jgi:hypothetical protein
LKPRLSRPLVAALVSGALVAGGTVYAAPVLAAGPSAGAATLDDTATPTSSPATTPSETGVPEETTGAPVETTTAAPVETTTAAPVETTTAAPVETTTAAPVQTTTAAPTTTPPTTTPTTAPPKDTKAPTGTFRLNLTSIWTGQRVTFGQTTGEYRAGRFNVTETLTDRSGNKFTTPAKAVTVTLPARYGLSSYKFYQGQRFYVNIDKVPAGTQRIRVDWGDGWVEALPGKNTKIPSVILYRKGTWNKISGNVKLRIEFVNKNGATGWLPLATANVLKDSWKPTLTITKPKKANRVSSWKTLKGTVKDKGAGTLSYVRVTMVRATTSGKVYCLTPKKKWKRYTTESQFMKYCGTGGVVLNVKGGKWSMKVPKGLTKGYVGAIVWTVDRADNYAGKIREANLTKK